MTGAEQNPWRCTSCGQPVDLRRARNTTTGVRAATASASSAVRP